jgi:ADP-heptose:LPS heptosyltransferase
LPSIKKILIIRLSSFGDIILSFPLIKKLREKFSGSEIHFLTKNSYKDVVALNPNVNKIILLDNSLLETRSAISGESYDLIIDIHKNFRSLFVSLFNAKKVRRYSKENFRKFLLVKFKINLFKDIIPVYNKYLLAIK